MGPRMMRNRQLLSKNSKFQEVSDHGSDVFVAGYVHGVPVWLCLLIHGVCSWLERSQPMDYEDVQNRPLWNLFGPRKIGKKQHPSNWTEKTQLKDTGS